MEIWADLPSEALTLILICLALFVFLIIYLAATNVALERGHWMQSG